MSTQDFQLDVINDCYDTCGQQHNDFVFQGQDNREDIDFMYRSAPNINGLRMNYMYQANDFVMNSCESIGNYGCFLYDQPEDISYEESNDDDKRPFQQGDIFDRMQELNIDNVNGSLVDEEQQGCEGIIGDDSNFSLDRAFNFNLNPMKHKNIGGIPFTDRVSCSLLGIDSHSRSQQKHKSRFMIDSKGPVIKDNNHLHNKQKFQPFKDFLKQSNILCEILPSNDINNSLVLSKSMLLDTNDMKKSILFDRNIKLSQQRQKLLKKIDKLMFSKSNNKFQQKSGENELENRQRRELKLRKFGVQEKDKQNPKKIEFESSSRIAQKLKKNAEPIQRDMKIFKRSKQNGQIKGSVTEKKKQNKEISNELQGLEKRNKRKSTRRNDQNQSCKVKQIQQQKVFIYEELSPSQINTLKNNLSVETFEVFVEFDKVYKQSINILGRSKQPAIESQAFIFSSLQEDIDVKSQALERQKKKLNEEIRNLDNERLYLKRVLDSEQNWNTDPKQQNNAGIPFIYKKITQKRQQMRSQFDLWREIGL